MAKRPKKKLTANQAEWKKQEKRIKQFIRRAEKRGYIFDDNIIPAKPKSIRKSDITKLKSLNPLKLYTKAHYVNPETGEYMSGEEGRKIERKRAAKRAARTREVNKGIQLANKMTMQDYGYYEDEEYGMVYADEPDRFEPVDTSIIKEIMQRVNEIPDAVFVKHKGYFDLSERKNTLAQIVDERFLIAEENNTLDDYIQFLKDNEAEIFEKIDYIIYNESDQQQVEVSFVRLATLLSAQNALSLQESQDIEAMAEYFGDAWGPLK